MAFETGDQVWRQDHSHSFTKFTLTEKGITVQDFTTTVDGFRIVEHAKIIVPFSKVKDLSEGQLTL